MMMQITQSDTGQVVWSPDRTKLAYITAQGLQAYVMDAGRSTNEERYVRLAEGTFERLSWSLDGSHLCASAVDGTLMIFRFLHGDVQPIYMTTASSLEWMDAHQLLYVPTDGGLVMLDLGGEPVEFRLTG
jgi:hypothetical protein